MIPPVIDTSSRSVLELLNKAKISCVIIICHIMANDESIPELEKILEHNFAEMKIGEDKFQQNEPTKQKISEDKKIIYQERYSSENQTGSITVKPIKATKKIIDVGIEVEDEVIEQPVEKIMKEVLDAPTSSIGDDFAVEW
tara:strand:+ start:1744 stop:2166 length:423 start_codon:yes stop_codon:yes gene_type:complete